MRIKSLSIFLLASALFVVFAAQVTQAQDPIKKKRLRSPATVRAVIGGESQAHYVIHARKGQTLTVSISWKKEDDNTASFGVSPDAGDNGEPLAGKETDDGKSWTGKIPATADYLISVVAHPVAHYTLKVKLR